jgi:hypothetical protein
MPYLSDTDFLREVDDEAWARGDEPSEAIPGPIYQRQYAGGGGIRTPIAPARPVTGLAGGVVNTPAGQAQVRFEKPLATKESVDELAKELKKELALQAEAIKKVDQTLDKNTAVLDKKIAAVNSATKKGLENAQQMSILPLLLSKPPQIASVQWSATEGANAFAASGTATVANTTYASDNNLMLPLVLMMSGGFGGGSSGDSSNMLLLALVLSGGLK